MLESGRAPEPGGERGSQWSLFGCVCVCRPGRGRLADEMDGLDLDGQAGRTDTHKDSQGQVQFARFSGWPIASQQQQQQQRSRLFSCARLASLSFFFLCYSLFANSNWGSLARISSATSAAIAWTRRRRSQELANAKLHTPISMGRRTFASAHVIAPANNQDSPVPPSGSAARTAERMAAAAGLHNNHHLRARGRLTAFPECGIIENSKSAEARLQMFTLSVCLTV